MTASPPFLVGATGSVGRALVRQLRDAGHPVRALARSDASAAELRDAGAEPVRGDLADPASLPAALAGVERLFLLTPPHERQVALQGAAIDAARAAGVRHVVKLSATLADPASSNALLRDHGLIERQLEASGMAWTHLRPASFMQNMLAFAGEIAATGRFHCPPAGAQPFVDVADVAAVAARCLTEAGHDGRAYEVTGPDALTYTALGARMGAALGRDVQAVEVPTAAAQGALVGMGMPVWLVDSLLDLYARTATGDGATPTDHVARVVGRPPRPVEDFAREHAAAFRAPPGAAPPPAAPPEAR